MNRSPERLTVTHYTLPRVSVKDNTGVFINTSDSGISVTHTSRSSSLYSRSGSFHAASPPVWLKTQIIVNPPNFQLLPGNIYQHSFVINTPTTPIVPLYGNRNSIYTAKRFDGNEPSRVIIHNPQMSNRTTPRTSVDWKSRSSQRFTRTLPNVRPTLRCNSFAQQPMQNQQQQIACRNKRSFQASTRPSDSFPDEVIYLSSKMFSCDLAPRSVSAHTKYMSESTKKQRDSVASKNSSKNSESTEQQRDSVASQNPPIYSFKKLQSQQLAAHPSQENLRRSERIALTTLTACLENVPQKTADFTDVVAAKSTSSVYIDAFSKKSQDLLQCLQKIINTAQPKDQKSKKFTNESHLPNISNKSPRRIGLNEAKRSMGGVPRKTFLDPS